MKKIIILIAITFSLGAKNIDKNKIYFDLCTGQCFKILSHNEDSTKTIPVKCTQKELKQMQPWNYKK